MFEGKMLTSADVWKPLPAVDDGCFGCGCNNPHGLQMKFESNGEMLRSTLTMDAKHRGWSNLIHGGVLSTLLDETMGWTVICLTRKFMLTRNMRVDFKRPVRIGAMLTVTGYIKERLSEKRALVVAEIRDERGELCVSSEGEFALFSREQFLQMNIIPEEDLAAMDAAVS